MKEKLDTLSDAILAIAMTILVLEIEAPKTMADLPDFGQQVLLFILSFIVIANFWYERGFFMKQARDIDLKILTTDLTAHLGICLIPLMTKVMFAYDDWHFSVVAYGLLLLFVSTTIDIENYMIFESEIKRVEFEQQALVLKLYRQFHVRAFILSSILIVLAYFFPFVIVYFYTLIPVMRFINRRNGERGLISRPKSMEALAHDMLDRYYAIQADRQKRHRS